MIAKYIKGWGFVKVKGLETTQISELQTLDNKIYQLRADFPMLTSTVTIDPTKPFKVTGIDEDDDYNVDYITGQIIFKKAKHRPDIGFDGTVVPYGLSGAITSLTVDREKEVESVNLLISKNPIDVVGQEKTSISAEVVMSNSNFLDFLYKKKEAFLLEVVLLDKGEDGVVAKELEGQEIESWLVQIVSMSSSVEAEGTVARRNVEFAVLGQSYLDREIEKEEADEYMERLGKEVVDEIGAK